MENGTLYRKTYALWLDNVKETELYSELKAIENDDEEIKERFLAEMLFGTAGLRGIIGAGISRMNAYTVGRATQGLADYINAEGEPEKGMAIAYDSRRFSREFAQRAAEILSGNGIKVYLFREITGVPELSFAVRHLNAFGGIVITASHNPRDYNGYKVYASYGGQLPPEESLRVMEYMKKVDAFRDVKSIPLEKGLAQGRIVWVGEEIDRAYYEKMLALCAPDKTEDNNAALKVVYTPLHGAGLRTAQNVFFASGIEHFYVVEEQAAPDGNFPTVKSPNPEDASAMEMAIALAGKTGADLAIGTDPDADRMGAAVKDRAGGYAMLTGNQIACILLSYLLEQRKAKGLLKSTDYAVKSFVSTRMTERIAQAYGIECHTVLTGFRFISEMIAESEGTEREFVFGFEESYGYLAGDISRDKDGVLAGLLLAKAAEHYKCRGKSLLDVLKTLYETYGYYLEKVKSITFEGIDGMVTMKKLMENLRSLRMEDIAGQKVLRTEDYLSGTARDASGAETPLALPKSDALRYVLEGDGWACVRPSGTEPKLKIYFGACEDSEEKAQKRLADLETGLIKRIGRQ